MSMDFSFSRALRTLLNWGVDATADEIQSKRIVLFNILAGLSFVLAVAHIPYYLYLSFTPLLFVQIAFCLSNLGSIFLTKYGRFFVARHLYLAAALLTIAGLSYYAGASSHVYVLFVGGIGAPFIFFGRSHFRSAILYVVLSSALCLYFVISQNDSLMPQDDSTVQMLKFLYFTCIASALILAAVLNYSSMFLGEKWQQKAEESLSLLASKHLLLKRVLDAFPGYVSIVNNQKQYVLVNSMFLKALDLDEEKILGKDAGFMKGDSFILESIASLAQSEVNHLVLVQNLHFRVDDMPRRHLVSISFLESYDLYACIAVDVHVEYELNQRLLQQQTLLEEAKKLAHLGEMAAGIAHEINNPMTIISGLSDQILKESKKDSWSKTAIQQAASKIVKSVDRVTKIIHGLQQASTFEPLVSKDSINLQALILESVDRCRSIFSTRDIDCVIEQDPSLKVEGSEAQLSQIIFNLLNNAFYAALEGSGKAWIKISVVKKAESVLIHITDSGLGISAENRERLMQPFFSTKDPDKGTGLGLSISQSLVRRHRGSLYYDDRFENTTFVLELPIKQDSL